MAASNLFCRVGRFSIIYLGLPIGGSISRLKLWEPLIERMHTKLATWKGKLLSIGGRLTLIKASLSNLPMYYMSLFPVPVGVVEKIRNIQRRFLWSGETEKKGLALVRWEIVQLPKKYGGLNVSNTLNRNLGLMLKWCWRYFQEPNSLWREIIRQKYKYPPTLTMAEISHINKGGPWKAICNHLLKNPISRNLLQSGFRMKIGNGEDTFFWHSIWISESPLKISFPRLFTISGLPMAKVSSMGHWSDGIWCWDPPWIRALRPRDAVEWSALSTLLQQVSLSHNAKDELVWIHHKKGMFSVKSFYEEYVKNSKAQLGLVAQKIWKNLIPHRIEIFLWLALLGKIATKSRLVRMKIIPPTENLCPLCKSEPEDVSHLMIHCAFSQSIWAWWLNLWGLKWVWPENLELAFSQWFFPSKLSFFKKIWLASFMVIVWSLWKERNNRTFKNESSSVLELQNLILLRICWWIKSWPEAFPYSQAEVLRNPSCLYWNDPSQSCPTQKPLILWSPPPSSTLKWNVDASYNPTMARAAIGGVLRNSRGEFLCMFSCPIPPMEINSAEVLAIHRAIQITINCDRFRSQRILIESDSYNAVKWCSEVKGGPWHLNFILNFIRSAPGRGLTISISHKLRSSNVVADAFAKQGLFRSSDFVAWL